MHFVEIQENSRKFSQIQENSAIYWTHRCSNRTRFLSLDGPKIGFRHFSRSVGPSVCPSVGALFRQAVEIVAKIVYLNLGKFGASLH